MLYHHPKQGGTFQTCETTNLIWLCGRHGLPTSAMEKNGKMMHSATGISPSGMIQLCGFSGFMHHSAQLALRSSLIWTS